MIISTKIERESWLEGRAGPSETSSEEKAWSSLWKLQVPSKVRVFLWRLARHSLPTTDFLRNRNMSVQDACPLCGGEDSWRHALVSCTMARCTWVLSEEEIVDRMRENGQTSAKHWLFDLYDTLNHDKFTKMAVTLWAIWFARRKAIHENIFQSPQQTSSFVITYLQELQTITKQSRQASKIVSQSVTAPR